MKKRIILLITILILLINCEIVFGASQKQDLKVLVIEINPILETITDTELYPDNDGHPKVSEYFGQETYKAIDELKEDLEFCSHGYLNIILEYEYLNEFPTYRYPLKNSDQYSFDEELYLKYAASKTYENKGDWYTFYYATKDMMQPYSLDYDYLIDKYDLVNRRNKGEFDQVWLNSIDPAAAYETIMVGNDPYWINGNPLKKDCPNFVFANISISRRDANLHALGHGVEGILSQIYNGTYFKYNKTYNDKTKEDYDSLNTWEKFSMIDSESTGENAGVGNVHFPFNGGHDYDYTNPRQVYSYWKNWLNYPYSDMKKELSDSDAWLKWEGNTQLGKDQNKDPDRLYMRWWFYLFPHVEGISDDGYQNNWWKYFVSLDGAKNVKTINNKMEKTSKDISDKEMFIADYISGKRYSVAYDSDFAKFIIDDESVIEEDGGKLKIVNPGLTRVTCYIDGVSDKCYVLISEKDGKYYFESSKELPDVWDKASNWAIDELDEAALNDLVPYTIIKDDFTRNITREEFAAVSVKLYEALTERESKVIAVNPFVDTDSEYVLKAYRLGITKGTSENTFDPYADITREQMATMLTRTIDKAKINTTINIESIARFIDDEKISDWAKESVYYMANKEIILGMGDNNFEPQGKASIEQALLVSNRSLKSIKE